MINVQDSEMLRAMGVDGGEGCPMSDFCSLERERLHNTICSLETMLAEERAARHRGRRQWTHLAWCGWAVAAGLCYAVLNR